MKTGEIIDRLRDKIRLKHYSLATEKTHVTGHGAGVLSPLDRVA